MKTILLLSAITVLLLTACGGGGELDDPAYHTIPGTCLDPATFVGPQIPGCAI